MSFEGIVFFLLFFFFFSIEMDSNNDYDDLVVPCSNPKPCFVNT